MYLQFALQYPYVKKYKCQELGCGKAFRRSDQLKRHHLCLHTERKTLDIWRDHIHENNFQVLTFCFINERPWICNFPNCNSKFGRSDHLQSHQKNRKHREEDPIPPEYQRNLPVEQKKLMWIWSFSHECLLIMKKQHQLCLFRTKKLRNLITWKLKLLFLLVNAQDKTQKRLSVYEIKNKMLWNKSNQGWKNLKCCCRFCFVFVILLLSLLMDFCVVFSLFSTPATLQRAIHRKSHPFLPSHDLFSTRPARILSWRHFCTWNGVVLMNEQRKKEVWSSFVTHSAANW